MSYGRGSGRGFASHEPRGGRQTRGPAVFPRSRYRAPPYRQPTAGPSSQASSAPEITPVPMTEEYLEEARNLLLDREEMEKGNFFIDRVPEKSIDNRLLKKKHKCRNCFQECVRKPERENASRPGRGAGAVRGRRGAAVRNDAERRSAPQTSSYDPTTNVEDDKRSVTCQVDPGPCHFHPGQRRGPSKIWTCCGGYRESPGCRMEAGHSPFAIQDVRRMWHLHPTPPALAAAKRQMVVFDCEMGVSITGDSEVISISAIDYFTGETLVDTLVYPDLEIVSTQARFSGVTKHELNIAESHGNCIMGRDNARQKMWEFIGPNTILVGHGLHNDLACLRWVHYLIVDTCVLGQKRFGKREDAEGKAKEEEASAGPSGAAVLSPAHVAATGTLAAPASNEPVLVTGHAHLTFEEADELGTNSTLEEAASTPTVSSDTKDTKTRRRRVKGHPDGTSLKALVKRTLGRDIQARGHSSMEDTIATRDLLHWFITNKPEEGVSEISGE